MFSAEDSGSGYHPIMYEKRSDDHGDRGSGFGGYLWAIVIVIIFLVIIFFAFAMMTRRDGVDRRDGLGSAAEIAALGALNTNGATNGADARAAFTELNGRFDALTQQVGHINDVNDLRDLKSTQAALSLQIANNRTDNLTNFKDVLTAVIQGNSDVNRNIDNNRFENAQNTCKIITNDDANTRAILDRLSQSEIAALRDELARERAARDRENLSASQAVQNAYLISQLRPTPIAAYDVLPPVPSARFA